MREGLEQQLYWRGKRAIKVDVGRFGDCVIQRIGETFRKSVFFSMEPLTIEYTVHFAKVL